MLRTRWACRRPRCRLRGAGVGGDLPRGVAQRGAAALGRVQAASSYGCHLLDYGYARPPHATVVGDNVEIRGARGPPSCCEAAEFDLEFQSSLDAKVLGELSTRRFVEERHHRPGPASWLTLRRPVGGGEVKHYLSNAPATMTLEEMAWTGSITCPRAASVPTAPGCALT